ncbi:MAG: TetR/AcrR family transcriptional regulator [Terriglobia bacterium]
MSPRRADPQLAQRRREVLIRAGYAEIVEKGIAATTIDSVVKRAGSSKGGTLYYFPTKEDLLFGVLEWLIAQLDRTLDEVSASHDSARARLVAEIEVLFHSAEVNRKLYRVLFDYVSLGVRADRFRALLWDFFERSHRRDIQIIEDGISQQEFRRVKADDAASTLRALVDGYCLQWLLGGDAVPLETYRDRCRSVLGSYLLR